MIFFYFFYLINIKFNKTYPNSDSFVIFFSPSRSLGILGPYSQTDSILSDSGGCSGVSRGSWGDNQAGELEGGMPL